MIYACDDTCRLIESFSANCFPNTSLSFCYSILGSSSEYSIIRCHPYFICTLIFNRQIVYNIILYSIVNNLHKMQTNICDKTNIAINVNFPSYSLRSHTYTQYTTSQQFLKCSPVAPQNGQSMVSAKLF